MSVKQMGMVWELDLAPNLRLVLLAYADHADDDGDNVFPSLGRVAHKTGYSADQVRRLSRELVADGLMELAEKGVGRGNTHRYRLTLDKGSKLPAFKPKQAPAQKVAESQEKVAPRPEKVAPMPPEPSEPSSLEPSSSPRGADAPKEEKPAKAMTTLAVDRTKEVGFDAAPHQVNNWGRGWSEFCYVGEGGEPPSAERQHAVLSEIVGAAAGKGGKARFFLSVQDAVKRVEETGRRNGHQRSFPGDTSRSKQPGPTNPYSLAEHLEEKARRRAS